MLLTEKASHADENASQSSMDVGEDCLESKENALRKQVEELEQRLKEAEDQRVSEVKDLKEKLGQQTEEQLKKFVEKYEKLGRPYQRYLIGKDIEALQADIEKSEKKVKKIKKMQRDTMDKEKRVETLKPRMYDARDEYYRTAELVEKLAADRQATSQKAKAAKERYDKAYFERVQLYDGLKKIYALIEDGCYSRPSLLDEVDEIIAKAY